MARGFISGRLFFLAVSLQALDFQKGWEMSQNQQRILNSCCHPLSLPHPLSLLLLEPQRNKLLWPANGGAEGGVTPRAEGAADVCWGSAWGCQQGWLLQDFSRLTAFGSGSCGKS